MAKAVTAPYGAWKSPISADLIVQGSIRLEQITLAGCDTYWLEGRPAEGGRNVLVRHTPGCRVADVTPAPYNVRTRVHEYGGGAYVLAGDAVYFSEFTDQRLYRQVRGGEPQPLTSAGEMRYGDAVVDGPRGRLICVREDHTVAGRQAANTLASIDLATGESRVLAAGNDFYTSPRLSPDGSALAWLTWNHPNMPWDGCELWVARLAANGTPAEAQCVAGGKSESIFQPEWSPDGTLYFVSDHSGCWNLYRWQAGRIAAVCEMQAEFGEAQWRLGMSTYGPESAGRLICSYEVEGTAYLGAIDTASGRLERIELPYTVIRGLRVAPGRAVFVAASPSEQPAIVELDLASGRTQVLRRAGEVQIDPGYLSEPEAVEFPTEQGLTAHGFYYPPRNRDHRAPKGELPPLLVMSHGGPTGATTPALELDVQYWTSRGIAVLDVNYGGSTGYGRAYRERLKGQWGVVDVDDCVNGARYLVARGLADADRLAIAGGSAGGYTTLCALTFRQVFKAGASYYGIGDLEAMARDTHKFESRYLDGLVGPYPEQRELYRQRSPIHYTDRLSCPVILFQGLEDKVVPPNQAEMMVASLRAKGLPVAYLTFEGEQHGFRRAETIKRALEAELYFYSRVFRFPLADTVEPVTIENLA